MVQKRPHTTVVLAMSADGKISDVMHSPARFGSTADKAHLEKQIAAADAVLFGAGTLRAYGTTLTVSHPNLLQHRQQAGKSAQPIHIVVTQSATLNPDLKFFQQPIKRWLVTTSAGAQEWQHQLKVSLTKEIPPQEYFSKFEQILVFETPTGNIDLDATLRHLTTLNIKSCSVLGGGTLLASMLELDLIDEFWLTICPLILGGASSPTPVEGKGFLAELAPTLQLIEVHTVEQEVFVHYRMQHKQRIDYAK